MLKRVSRFVLEVLPYVLSALIAAVVVPGFLNSQLQGRGPAGMTNTAGSAVNTLELVRQEHAAFAPALAFPDRPPSSVQRQPIAK